MAKKSAKSKGYRKTVTQKPYLSKRDIVLLCVVAAALAVGAFFLFRYDDGALKVQDGSVITEGDNWLIVNGSNTRGGTRYYKLGDMGELDGYSRTTGAIATDANIPEYTFTPAAEGSGIARIAVTTSHNAAETLAQYASSMLADTDNIDIGEVQTVELDGQSARYFIYTAEETAEESADSEPDAENQAASPYSRMLSGYLDAEHDSCVVIHIECNADAPQGLPTDEALLTVLEQVISAVTVEGGK